MSNNERRWVVWYLHWRFHRSSVDTNDWYRSREDAFYGAWYVEAEAEDCVNEVIGIEDPDGNFIDLDEWRAACPEIRRKHDEEERRSDDEYKDEPKFRITITGPPRPEGAEDDQKGNVYKRTEVWTAKYLDEYRARAIAQFGADRVTVEEIITADGPS